MTLAAPPQPWTTLFNDPRFLAIHAPAGAEATCVEVRDEEDRVLGALAGVLDDGTFTSGYSAPFGGFDLARADETPSGVDALVDGALAQLRDRGARRIVIRCRPSCWHATEDAVRFSLMAAGFSVALAELTFHVPLHGLASAADYRAGLKREARRALNGSEAFELVEVDRLGPAYALLAANRAGRGRSLSMPLARVEAVREAFGDRVRMVELHRDGEAVAAALTYRVAAGGELVVWWGDRPGAGGRPMNALALRLVERALAEGLSFLDLGISSVPDAAGRRRPQAGLVQFKRSIGAVATLQPVLVAGTA